METEPDSNHSFLYHRVPPELYGSVLYPLNQMKDVFPELYAKLRQNYASREDIAALRIPPLGDCLWNDVLHLSPVHPAELMSALKSSGHKLPSDWATWFQIDSSLLAPEKTVIYRNRLGPLWSGKFDVAEASRAIGSECAPFLEETLALCKEIPTAAKQYYAAVDAGAPLMYFLNVPHVFYKGRLDLTNGGIKRIEV